MSPRCVRAVGIRRPLALFGDAKQAMCEGKSGPVETGLTGMVATALCLLSQGNEPIVLCLAVEIPWLALDGPFLTSFAQTGLENTYCCSKLKLANK